MRETEGEGMRWKRNERLRKCRLTSQSVCSIRNFTRFTLAQTVTRCSHSSLHLELNPESGAYLPQQSLLCRGSYSGIREGMLECLLRWRVCAVIGVSDRGFRTSGDNEWHCMLSGIRCCESD